MDKNSAAEIIGWIGAIAILCSYGLLSFGIISGDMVIYHVLFLVGSIGLAVITYRHRAFQSFTVNGIFIVIALIAIIRLAALA